MNSMAVMTAFARSIVAVLLILSLALLLGMAGPRIHVQDGQGQQAPSEQSETQATATLISPARTLSDFMQAWREERFEDALERINLDGLPREAHRGIGANLYHVLEHVSWVAWFIPTTDDFQASGIRRYTVFPQESNVTHARLAREHETAGTIVLEWNDGAWQFTSNTAEDIGALFDDLQILQRLDDADITTAQSIEQNLPDVLTTNKVIGLKYWQWIGLFALILAGVVVDFSLRGILMLIAVRMIRRRGGEATRDTMKKTVRPFGLFVNAVFWLYAIDLLGLPTPALIFVLPALKVFAMFASVWAAYRVTDLLSEVASGKAAETSTKIDDLLIPLLRKAVKIFIAAIGLIYIADGLNIDILPLLTSLGIGGLAVAFAAKDTIENFFGSIAVIIDRPFEVGDWVVIDGDTEGVIEELGFRSTRIRTFHNSLVTVPNATLVRANVDNYGRRKYRRWTTHLNITYDTPPEKIESFCEGIREIIRLHPYTRKDYYQVWFHQFGPHSLDILIYVFHEAPDWQTELRERERLMLDIIRLANELGVEFAFPTQTLHVSTDDAATDSERPADATNAAASSGRSQRDGRFAARRITQDAAWRREKPAPYRFPHPGVDTDDDEDSQVESRVGGDA